MHPILFRIGPLAVSSYGVSLALAFLLVVGLIRHATTHALRGSVPLTETAVMDWAVWAVAGGIIGGRLLYVMLNWELYRIQPSEIVALWHGGLIWYGGLLGGILATAIYFRIHRYAFLRGMDQVTPAIPLGHAIGRIGCFLNGCCYGKPTAAWFGVQFPGHPGPVVPTQLIESASLIVLFAILWRSQTPSILRGAPQASPSHHHTPHGVGRHPAQLLEPAPPTGPTPPFGGVARWRGRPGTLFGFYLIGYALIRWVVEFWRADQPIIGAGLTLHQLISAGLLCVGGSLVVKAARQRSPSSNQQSAVSNQ